MPGSLDFATHRGFVELAQLHLAPLPPLARRMILCDNALRVYFGAAPVRPHGRNAPSR